MKDAVQLFCAWMLTVGVSLTVNPAPLVAQARGNLGKFYQALDTTGWKDHLQQHFESSKALRITTDDTLLRIFQLHHLLLMNDRHGRGRPVSSFYFFVQQSFPEVWINGEVYQPATGTFYNPLIATDTDRSLVYDTALVREIKIFLGPNPVNSRKLYIRSYLKDRHKERERRHKRAAAEFQEYNRRLKFVLSGVDLCCTWGYTAADFSAFSIDQLRMNKEMTSAEVTWSTCAYGSTSVYRYVSGAWVLERVIMEWIH